MLRTLLFDLGNVLLRFSHERMFSQMAAACGCSVERVRQVLRDERLQAEFERGRLTPQAFYDRFTQAVGATDAVSFEQLCMAASDIFEPDEPMLALVSQLRASGFRLVLLSNTCQPHIEHIRDRYDVLDRFDACVLSYQVGAVKPEPAIFEAAAVAAQAAPQECFYTDDLEENVQAGRRFGFDAETFTDIGQLRRQLRRRGVPLD